MQRKTVHALAGKKQNKVGNTSQGTGGRVEKVLSRNDRDSKQMMPAKRKRRQRVERWILNGENSAVSPTDPAYRIQAESETESCSSETCSELDNSSPNLEEDVERLVTGKIRSGSESGYVTKSGSVSPLASETIEKTMIADMGSTTKNGRRRLVNFKHVG